MLIDFDYRDCGIQVKEKHAGLCPADTDLIRALQAKEPMHLREGGFPFPPFEDITFKMPQHLKREIIVAAMQLYRNELYGIVRAAYDKMDKERVAHHFRDMMEQVASVALLRDYFSTVERIRKISTPMEGLMELEFIFVNQHKAYDGRAIKLRVPVWMQYRPTLEWTAGTPDFYYE